MRNEELMSNEEVDSTIDSINSSKGNIRASLHRLNSTKAYKHKLCSSMRDFNRKYLEMDQSTMYREINAAEVEVLVGLPINSVKASVLVPLFKLKSDDQKIEVWEFTVRRLKKLFPNQKWPTAKNIAYIIERKGFGKPPREKVVDEAKLTLKINEYILLICDSKHLKSIIINARHQLCQSGDF